MSQHLLKPNWEPGSSITKIPIKHFLDNSIRALVLDVDKTLLAGRDLKLQGSVKDWVITASKHLEVHLLSNNPSKKRIGAVAAQLDLPYTYGAGKPRRGALIKVMRAMKINPKNIALIGDRLFTDVLAGNRLGFYTILVQPIDKDGNAALQDGLQRFEQKIANLLGASKP